MQNSNTKPLKYIFDIDGTICSQEKDYLDAQPYMNVISQINKLYDDGNEIVQYTARGTETGIDWFGETYRQFADWGVKYHDLKFGKPPADIYVDDKGCFADDFFNNESILYREKTHGENLLLN